jgi:hypothetical protein
MLVALMQGLLESKQFDLPLSSKFTEFKQEVLNSGQSQEDAEFAASVFVEFAADIVEFYGVREGVELAGFPCFGEALETTLGIDRKTFAAKAAKCCGQFEKSHSKGLAFTAAIIAGQTRESVLHSRLIDTFAHCKFRSNRHQLLLNAERLAAREDFRACYNA